MELHARLPDVPHVQDPDRVAAARLAVEELEAEVILMDDGFQHRRLFRDLDILVIDATCPFGFGYPLPRGLLREPMNGLQRADAIVITRCQAVTSQEIKSIQQTIMGYNAERQYSQAITLPLLCWSTRMLSCLEDHQDQTVGVVSAIGNPEAFEMTVRQCGAKIQSSRHLPDHDPYSPESVAALQKWARSLGDEVAGIVCTHKDLVKLQTDRLGGKRLFALQIDLTLDDPEKLLHQMIDCIAEKAEANTSANDTEMNEVDSDQTTG